MKKIQKLMAGVAVLGMAAGIAMAGDANKIVVDGSTTVGPITDAAES